MPVRGFDSCPRLRPGRNMKIMRGWWTVLVLVGVLVLLFFFRGGSHRFPDRSLSTGPHSLKPIQPDDGTQLLPSAEGSLPKGNLSDRFLLRRDSSPDRPVLEIRVSDRSTGDPIESAAIRASGRLSSFQVGASTDSTGLAVVRLVEDEYKIRIEKPDYLAEELDLGLPPGMLVARREVELSRAALVHGSVTNQHDQAVAGARVSLELSEPRSTEQTRKETTTFQARTLADGSFSMRLVPGHYRAQVVKRPHLPGRLANLELVAGENLPLELQIAELDQVVVLEGIVEELGGEAVGGALVRIGQRVTNQTRVLNSTRTDAEGGVRLELPPRPAVQVEISAGGFRGSRRQVDLTKAASMRFVLEGFQAFSVQVVGSGGRVIERARVHGRSPEGTNVLGRRADGRYYSRTYPFQVFADGLEQNLGVTEVVTVAEFQPEIRLHIPPGGNLHGSVADREGAPVKAFSVTVDHHGLSPFGRQFHSEDGSFRLADLPEGRLVVKVRAPGFEETQRPLLIHLGETLGVEVTLIPTPPKNSIRSSDEKTATTRSGGSSPRRSP